LRSTSMRTSMRPRSAGSSRISKLVLPLFTEAAISTASPLTGTGAPVAAVALKVAVETALVDEEGSCGCSVAVAGKLGSDEVVDVGPVSGAARSTVAASERDALSEILALAATERALPASGLAETAGCGAALFGASVVDAVADAVVVGLSDTSDVASEADDVAAFA
jgi:hypothetical protein